VFACAPSPPLPPRLAQEEDDELLPSHTPKAIDYFAGTLDEGWSTLLYAHRYAAVIESGEADATIALDVHGKEELARNTVAHGTPVNCFKDRHPELLHELTQTSAHYMSLLRQLFSQLRLLSFTAGNSTA
jgi:hypothetical protein